MSFTSEDFISSFLKWGICKFKLFNLSYQNQSVIFTISKIRWSELAGLNDESLFGSKCLTAGWGLTRTNGHRSAVLRKAVTMNGSKKYFIYSENFITKCEIKFFLILLKSRGFSSSFLSEFQEIDAYLFYGPRWWNL